MARPHKVFTVYINVHLSAMNYKYDYYIRPLRNAWVRSYKGPYYICTFCKTDREYADLRKEYEFDTKAQPSAAFFAGSLIGEKRKRGPWGVVVFKNGMLNKGSRSHGLIAHECFHMLKHFLRRRKKWTALMKEPGNSVKRLAYRSDNSETLPEEFAAHTLHRMVQQITEAYKQAKGKRK